MKKYFKLATFIIVLCMCSAITGCFGNKPKEEPKQQNQANTTQTNSNYLETLSESEKQSIIVSCKSNEKDIGVGCEMYAADHEGRYPKTLDELSQNGYIREMPTCPLDSSNSYKFISRAEPFDYYIIKCPNHKIIFESQMGLLDEETKELESSLKKYYDSLSNGKIYMVGEGQEISLTDDEMKKLGFK